MKLESQITARELSERLRDLGVKQLGTFYWRQQEGGPWSIATAEELAGAAEFVFAPNVAELGVTLPFNAIGQRIEAKTPYWVHYFEEDNLTGRNFDAMTEADARAKMLIHLLEQKLITVEEVNARLSA